MYEILIIPIFNQVVKIMNIKWYIVKKYIFNSEIKQTHAVSSLHCKISEYKINFMNTKEL